MIAQPNLKRLGFDTARLHFTMRTAVAACLALLIAWLGGLEHPQWSAMTVWAASLPVRGHLIEKSVFRGLGTVVGATFGTGLLLVSGGQPWVLVIGLAIWIGLCAGAGNIVRGFASYGAMLAGYTAAMVALLHSGRTSDPFAVGVDRTLTVLIGLLIALAVGWILAARGDSDDPAWRVRTLSRQILQDLFGYLAGGARPAGDAHLPLLSEMALIEDTLDHQAAGSSRSRKATGAVRRMLSAQVAILLWMRRGERPTESTGLTAALQEAVNTPDADEQAGLDAAALLRAAGLTADAPLREALSALAAAETDSPVRDTQPVLTLHRDWIGAREALLRAAFIIVAVGAIWLLTGWDAGAFMLLGTAIMTTVFSTADDPARTLREVLLGQTLGVIGALACRWLVWPLADSEIGLVLSMIPFILFGGVLFGHRRSSGPIGFDYNMIVLLLLQPVWPLSGTFTASLSVGAAVILGPAVGLIAFLLIFPVTGERRLGTLVAMMVHEIEVMAENGGASRGSAIWRARLYHRILRLVRWADKTGASRQDVVDGAFALMLAGSSVLHIDGLYQKLGSTPATARRLDATRARLRKLGRDPQRAARALVATADRLSAIPGVDSRLLQDAATELSTHGEFIERARTSRKTPASPA